MDRNRKPDRQALRKLRQLFIYLWAIGGTAGIGTASELTTTTASEFEVVVREDLVTLTVGNANLEEVLQEIARQAGFRFRSKGELSLAVGWSFTDTPVEIAIARLLQRESAVMIYAHDDKRTDRRLATVLVLGSQTRSASGSSVKHAMQPEEPTWEVQKDDHVSWNSPRVEAFLQSLLPQDIDHVRERLADLPETPSADDLGPLLSKEEDPAVRAVAIIGLSSLRDETAKEALVAALEDNDRQVRLLAVQAMGLTWGEAALDPLRLALMEDPSPLVRSNAAISIAQFSKDTAVAVLSEAQFDPDANVQEVVGHALARLEP